jgi:hypothetical protein
VLALARSVNEVGNCAYPGPRSGSACSFGGRFAQPEVTVPAQVLVLIADSVSSNLLTANTVCSASSAATKLVLAPAGTVAGAWWQPEVTRALQAAPLITDTEPRPPNAACPPTTPSWFAV